MSAIASVRPFAVLLALSAVLAACGDDGGITDPPDEGPCSDALDHEQRWEFDEDLDGWTADSLDGAGGDAVRHSDGDILLRGRGGEEDVPNAWLSHSVSLPNACLLLLRYEVAPAGLGSGALRIRYESGGTSHVLSDWLSYTGPGGGELNWRTREHDISEHAGTTGTLLIEWDNRSSQSDDYGVLYLDNVEIRSTPASE